MYADGIEQQSTVSSKLFTHVNDVALLVSCNLGRDVK